jgi:hypothetical protein
MDVVPVSGREMKRMKKTLIFCMSVLTVTFLFITAFELYAGSNESLCTDWCNQHKELCKKCSDKAGCGVGYESIVTFKLGLDHWHACKGNERNKEACEAWCNAHKPQCVKCDDNITCGTGYKRIMGFTGTGSKNYHACEKTAYKSGSEAAKAACETWCNAHKPQCVKCDTNIGCGFRMEHMKSFGYGDRGDNWFACKRK